MGRKGAAGQHGHNVRRWREEVQEDAKEGGPPRRPTLRARAPVDYVLATHGFARDDSDDGDYQPGEDPDNGVDDEMQDLGDAESPLTGDSDAGVETLAMMVVETPVVVMTPVEAMLTVEALVTVEMLTLTLAMLTVEALATMEMMTLTMSTVEMLTLAMVIVEMLTLVMLTVEALALMMVEMLTVEALAMVMVEMLTVATVEALVMLTGGSRYC
ncbi:hypothetical protein PF008_g19199 [Phytophthora fragariae]|uniref:Uncharacterized protein n=1 Tax=Phytophthora fragariae TaxID=53985 RepID=A0A6G0R4E1_9STRA|nr:hypothetical protein PF008_g19199 [Phytophthora fragariae]